MDILYIAPYFSFRQGGVSEVVYQLATHLTQKGHQVTLLTSDYLADQETQTGFSFDIVRLPSFSRWGFYLTPKMIPWLRTNLEKFDIVHLQEFRTFQNIAASCFARNTTTPLVFTAHGTMPNIIEKRLFKGLFDLFFKRLILNQMTAFTAVSEEEVNDYLHVGVQKNKIILILNGLNVDELTKPSKQMPIKTDNDRPELKRIIFLGRLHKKKRIDRLLKAFSVINQHSPNTQVIIAGPDNGEQANLRNLAHKLGVAERVSFPGPVYGEQKVAFLQSADVLAYPSSHEVFGLVPFEALMCGTPVVVTAGTGMGDLIHQAGAGQTVPQDDPQALADALLWALANPQAAQVQVRYGQRFIKENLDWPIIAGQYEMLYQQVLKL
jgi:glycosyltransferase involved in cell wall biosynthesis